MKKYIISLVFVLAAGIPVLGQTSYLSEIKIVNREVAKTADRQARVKMTVNLDNLDIKNSIRCAWCRSFFLPTAVRNRNFLLLW